MQTRYVIIFLLVCLCVSFVQAEPPREELCMDGTLLFREDFGGNDPNDPDVSMASVPGMSSNYYNSGNSLGSGHYTIRKEGWQNGIQWHRQDDHTYPNDKTRGYLLEIDGVGGSDPFYSKTIDGLCEGSTLTFSAYVVNVHYAGQIYPYLIERGYIYPRLKFVLKNSNTGDILASQSTGDIMPDMRYETPEAWKEARDNKLSAEWQLVGMNFTVPVGVQSIQMFIYNDVAQNGNGNDFAIDDIEIHLCLPPVTIDGEAEVCEDATASLTANFTNDGTLAEPLEYRWWHSEDSLTWTELSNTSATLTLPSIQKTDSGWYKVAVAGAGNIVAANCRAQSEPFRLSIKECGPHHEDLCMDGTLLFREDFGGNDSNDPRVSTTPVSGMSYIQATTDVWDPANLSVRAGKYIVTKSGYCNGDTAQTNAPNNRRSQWFIQDDHTYPNDYTRGYFMEVDGKGDNAVFYTTDIEGLCAGMKLTFLAYVANLQLPWYYENQDRAYPRLKFTLIDPSTNAILATYDTGDIPYDSRYMGMHDWNHSSKWYLVGMNFVVPENINAITLQIANNAIGNNGNDFAIDDIEIHLCLPPVTIDGEAEACEDATASLTANFTNDGTLAEPLEYRWWHSEDSLTWAELSNTSATLTLPTIQKADSGWYKVAVAGAGNIASTNCRALSEPFLLTVMECEQPCPELHFANRDTTVCDTLMPFTWHGLLFSEPGSQTTTLQDERDCDTLQTTWTLNTRTCCPDIQTITRDTTVCDILLPFTWIINERTFVFEQAETQEISIPHSKWENCTGTIYTIRLDTIHCEQLYDIIVNKYNWVLLCNNVRVRALFPQRTVTGYQWYKDGTAIPNATEDDYSEQNELQGDFQLRLHMDDGNYVWSEILTIQPSQTQAPSRIRIYRHNGCLFYQAEGETAIPSLPRGLYIIQIEQNGEQRIEKKLIP